MRPSRMIRLVLLCVACLLGACGGEEYYSTPEKTLQRYVDNRMMTTREQYESCLNAFTKEDREWWDKHYLKICTILYDKDCPGESLVSEVTVWTDLFEPAGPSKAVVESSRIDDGAGTAVLTVDGKEISFVKKRGNWKINGFFGVKEKLTEKYPELKDHV